MLLVDNWMPTSVKMFVAPLHYTYLCYSKGYVGYADYKNKLLSMHFYANCALKRPLILTRHVVILSILLFIA